MMSNDTSQPTKGKRKLPAATKKKPGDPKSRHSKGSLDKPAVQRKRKQTALTGKHQAGPAAKYLRDYLKQLRAMRKGGAPTRAEIEQGVKTWESQIADLKAEIKQSEALAKKRKREIDDWKQWYHGIGKIDRSEEWAKLEAEIAWRAQEINAAQKKINQLYEKHLQVQTQLEMARHWLIAYDHGILDKPLEEDPRYVQILQWQTTGTKSEK
jgi:hypothetical protein